MCGCASAFAWVVGWELIGGVGVAQAHLSPAGDRNAQRDGVRDRGADVDVGDGAEFVCEDLVVKGEPEPLEADLLLEDDSNVEVVS